MTQINSQNKPNIILSNTKKEPNLVVYSYWILSGILIIVLGIASFNYPYDTYNSDCWEHTASLKALSSSLLLPKNPHLNISGLSARYTPYLIFWSLVKNALNINVFNTIALSSITNLILILSGLYFFLKKYFEDKSLPVYMLIVMLFFWGRGFLWSNEYQLRSLIYNLGYPSSFAFGCFLWSGYFVVRFLLFCKIWNYLVVVLGGIVILLCHPPTAALLFLSAAVLAIVNRPFKVQEAVSVFLLPFICIFISFLWPYFSMYDLFFSVSPTSIIEDAGEKGYVPNLRFYSKSMIYAVGPAFIGIFFIWHYIVQKKNWFIVLCFSGFTFLFVIAYFYPIIIGHRFIFNALLFLHLAIAYKFGELRLFSAESIREAVCAKTNIGLLKLLFLTVSIVAILYNLNLTRKSYPSCISTFEARADSKVNPDHKDLIHKFSFLTDIIEPNDIVMADRKTSWVLPTFSGKVISVLENHGNPLLTDGAQRRHDISSFFEKDTDQQTREELLRKYDASYILINNDWIEPQIAAEIEKSGTVIIRKNDLVLIKI